jgi:hypothetical protein
VLARFCFLLADVVHPLAWTALPQNAAALICPDRLLPSRIHPRFIGQVAVYPAPADFDAC